MSNFTGKNTEMDYTPEIEELLRTLHGVSELKHTLLNRNIAKKLLDEGLIEIKGRRTSGKWILNPEESRTNKTSTVNIKHFSTTINDISPRFESIFNQATRAYNLGMKDICGGGFRKALEFLLYDYIIKKNPSDLDIISDMGCLSNVVATYIHDGLLQNSIEAASWVGNDTLHYFKKYEELGTEELIEYIFDVVQCIEVIETGEGQSELLSNLNIKLEKKKDLMPDLGLSPKERKKRKKKSKKIPSDMNE